MPVSLKGLWRCAAGDWSVAGPCAQKPSTKEPLSCRRTARRGISETTFSNMRVFGSRNDIDWLAIAVLVVIKELDDNQYEKMLGGYGPEGLRTEYSVRAGGRIHRVHLDSQTVRRTT